MGKALMNECLMATIEKGCESGFASFYLLPCEDAARKPPGASPSILILPSLQNCEK
jgi:hypothetical protein